MIATEMHDLKQLVTSSGRPVQTQPVISGGKNKKRGIVTSIAHDRRGTVHQEVRSR